MKQQCESMVRDDTEYPPGMALQCQIGIRMFTAKHDNEKRRMFKFADNHRIIERFALEGTL